MVFCLSVDCAFGVLGCGEFFGRDRFAARFSPSVASSPRRRWSGIPGPRSKELGFISEPTYLVSGFKHASEEWSGSTAIVRD